MLGRSYYFGWSFSLTFRVFLPTLEEYFSEALEQADPAAMVEEEYKYGCLLKCSRRYVFNAFNSAGNFITKLKISHPSQPCDP